MLRPINYIIDPILLHEASLADDIMIVLNIDVSNRSGVISTYSIVEQFAPSLAFFILIDIKDQVQELAVQDIISFFFFPNYRKINGLPVVLIKQDPEKAEYSTNLLTNCAKRQGYADVKFHYVDTKELNPVTIYTPDAKERIQSGYSSLLRNFSAFALQELYIVVSSKEDIYLVDKLLMEEEAEFAKANQDIFSYLQEYKHMREQLEESELVSRATKQEIVNLTSSIEVLKSGSQAKHLQHYYNNEYEILPKWYKQIGHIIKVLTGKRTFKSLFSDKVKKYNQ